MKSWHCHLGHSPSQVLTKLVSTQALPMSTPHIFSSHCDSCLSNKVTNCLLVPHQSRVLGH